MTIDLDRLLTVDEAAEFLRVNPVTVRRHIWAGELPAIRLGKLVRIDPAELRAVLEAKTHA